MFKCDLGIAIGKDLDELDRMDSRQLSTWFAYAELKGLINWDQTAKLCEVIAQSHGNKVDLYDFHPFETRPKKKLIPMVQTADEQKNMFKAMFPQMQGL